METETLLLLGGVVLLLMCSAFFSGSETALMSSSKPKLRHKEQEGDERAARVNRVISNPERLLSTILLGNNLVNIAASALTTGLFIKLFGDSGIAIATLVMTFIVLIFAEILPKTIASKNPENHSMWISAPMSVLIPLLSPFTKGIGFIARGLMRLLGINPDDDSGKFGEEDVRGAIGMGLEEGVLEKRKHRMLDSILELDVLTVEDIMVHRSNLQTMDVETDVEEIFQTLAKKRTHSRIPMWKENADNIVGILHVKDFIHAYQRSKEKNKPLEMEKILQTPYFVPENAKLSQQMLEFRKKRRHMALVVDEYGNLEGLLTLEDILEEIVGDIHDEHDAVVKEFVKDKEGAYILAGTFSVRDANRDLEWKLPAEDSVTIAGLLIEKAEGIPAIGEQIVIENYTFTVLTKKRQAIEKVRVTIEEVEETEVAEKETT